MRTALHPTPFKFSDQLLLQETNGTFPKTKHSIRANGISDGEQNGNGNHNSIISIFKSHLTIRPFIVAGGDYRWFAGDSSCRYKDSTSCERLFAAAEATGHGGNWHENLNTAGGGDIVCPGC